MCKWRPMSNHFSIFDRPKHWSYQGLLHHWSKYSWAKYPQQILILWLCYLDCLTSGYRRSIPFRIWVPNRANKWNVAHCYEHTLFFQRLSFRLTSDKSPLVEERKWPRRNLKWFPELGNIGQTFVLQSIPLGAQGRNAILLPPECQISDSDNVLFQRWIWSCRWYTLHLNS